MGSIVYHNHWSVANIHPPKTLQQANAESHDGDPLNIYKHATAAI
jgi:hypothetical protein